MQEEDNFYIVAIGLSAGGLPALQEVLSTLPRDTNASFVVIAHLPIESNSQLDRMLANATHLQIGWIQHGERARINSLHLLPPGYLMTIQEGCFQLQSRDVQQRINRSIDMFFTSLAREVKQRAIGIVLSGNGSDGLVGVQAIEAYGGLVLVQHPDTALFDSMPANVVAKDHPDFIASPQGIGQALRCHLQIPPFLPAGGN